MIETGLSRVTSKLKNQMMSIVMIKTIQKSCSQKMTMKFFIRQKQERRLKRLWIKATNHRKKGNLSVMFVNLVSREKII